MSRTDQHKPTGKPGRKTRKPGQRNKESDRKLSAKSDHGQDPKEEIEIGAADPSGAAPMGVAPVADAAPTSFLDQQQEVNGQMRANAEPANKPSLAVAPVGGATPNNSRREEQHGKAQIEAATRPAAALASAAAPAIAPISLQTVARAYGDYTRKSMEQTRFFVERLSSVRSLDKAVEVQIEFTKQTLETFVTEMQKIYGLQSELARQSLKPWERLAAMTREVR
jgi:hypothetical protein